MTNTTITPEPDETFERLIESELVVDWVARTTFEKVNENDVFYLASQYDTLGTKSTVYKKVEIAYRNEHLSNATIPALERSHPHVAHESIGLDREVVLVTFKTKSN